MGVPEQAVGIGVTDGTLSGHGVIQRGCTWGIPANAGWEEVPIDLAQELGQGVGEEGEVKLVSDEVTSPAQEIHQGLGIGVQLCRHTRKDMVLAPHWPHPIKNGVPPPVKTPWLTTSSCPGTAGLLGQAGTGSPALGGPAGPGIEGAEAGTLGGLLLGGQLGQRQQVEAARFPAAGGSCKGSEDAMRC